MKVYMRRRGGEIKWVLTASELWTADLDDGRDFDEALAAATVKEFTDLAAEEGRDVEYWAE